MTNSSPDNLSPAELLNNAVEGMRLLPPVGAVTFRGNTTPRSVEPSICTTRGITATSRDLTVATIGLTSPGIAAFIVHTGRDLTPLSATPEAQEIALLPGTVLLTGRFVDIAGCTVEVVEQLVPTDNNQWTSTTTEQDFAAFVDTIAAAITNSRGRPCPVDPTYCERFTAPIL